MTIDEGQPSINRISRRSLLRGGLLAGAGVATVGACAANSVSTSGPTYPPFGPHNAGSSTVYDMYWTGTY